MKKTLACLLALVMLASFAVSASALSWTAADTSSSSSPFSIEVIKLTANADVTGSAYYTVVEDAAAYGLSTIYYAIKLTLPSASEASTYYAGSSFVVNDQVKVTITYTNISGKSKETYYVALTGYSQTLWFNGSGFDAAWTDQLVSNCGCNNRHIMASTVTDTANAGIKACVGASGDIANILIGNCYKVAEKTYYGIRPCQRCAATNLSGYLFTTDCGQNSIFFSTNSAGKVTGIYVYENCSTASSTTEGAMVMPTTTLYRWGLSGSFFSWPCNSTICTNYPAFTYVALGADAVVDYGANLTLNAANPLTSFSDYGTGITAAYWNAWVASSGQTTGAVAGDSEMLYVKNTDGTFSKATPANWNTKGYTSSDGAVVYYKGTSDIATPATTAISLDGISSTTIASLYGSIYRSYGGLTSFRYNNVYFALGGETIEQLYAVQAETVVECDTPDLAFWNSVSYLLSLLGITYADIAAGNVYMTEDNLLANFGFATNVCAEKIWNAYTAAITVAEVAEVPATGGMSYLGFALLLSAIAVGVARKRLHA